MKVRHCCNHLQKDFKNSSKNYRAMSLTCVPCRVFKYIVAESLLCLFFSHNLLGTYQFVFLPGCSSCSQLLCAISMIGLNVSMLMN